MRKFSNAVLLSLTAMFCLFSTVFAAAQTTISATTVSFSNVVVGTTSGTRTVTLKNIGTASITISTLAVTPGTPYAITAPSTCLHPTLAAGASCTVVLTFSPTILGAQLASSLTITTTASNPTSTVALSGTGVAPTAVSPAALNLGNVGVGATSTAKTVMLLNYQTTALGISSITAPASYAVSSTTCGSTLAAGTYCIISVTLSPTALGPVAAESLTITTNAPNNPLTVALSGTGISPTAVSPAALNFGNVGVGTTSAAKTVQLFNYQSTALGISSITAPASYAVSATTCGSTLAAGANCTISVTLSPTALGPVAAESLTITTNGPNSPLMVALSGTGIVPTAVSPVALNFGNVGVGAPSTALPVMLLNYQSTALAISSITAPTNYAVSATTCGSTLAAGTNCTISVTLSPTALGPVAAESLTIITNAPNSPLTVALSGTGVVQTAVSPAALNFGNVGVGTTSAAKTVMLFNYQSTALGISSITAPASYAVSATTCGSTLAAGANCTISVTLSPTALGPVAAESLTITTNAPSSPLTVALSGTGVVPTAVSPVAMNFSNIVVNQASTAKTAMLLNYQLTPLTITSITAPASYAVSATTCGSTVAPGAFCTISVTLTPTALGAVPAESLTIVTDAPNSPLTVALSGAGIQPVSLNPSSIGFGILGIGETSATKNLILTNNQNSNLSISSVIFNGPFALDTSAVTTCPVPGGLVSGQLAAGTSCFIGVVFQPTVIGATTGGQITVIDSAPSSPQVAALSGTGVVPVTVSLSTLAFGNVQTGTISAPMTVTVRNNQPNTLNIASLGVTPGTPYSISASSTCLNPTLSPGASCTVVLTFSPTSLGAAPTSALTITDDAASSPQTVHLTGSGVGQVTLSPTSLAFGTVVVNNAVTKNVTLTNNQGSSLTITSFTGFPAAYSQGSVANSCTAGLVVPAGGNCVIAVTLTATATGAQSGTISINDSASTSPQIFTVSANAIAPVVLSPTSLSFAAQQVGTTSSPAKTVTLNNEQSVALNISGATITGPNSSDFNVTTTCPLVPSSLAASGNCPLQVTFTPSASGTRTATLNVNDDAQGSPQTIPLSGSGSAPVTVLPGLLTYTAPVGSTSAYQTVTITNASSGSVQFTSLLLSGDFIQTSTDCGALPFTLASGGHCKVALSFNPSIGGVRDGQLQVYDTAPTSPQVINLTGTGTSPLTLSVSSLSFSAQTVNTSSPAKVITLTNHETESETFSLGTTGDFSATSNCGTGTMPIAANSSCLVYVTFTPSSVLPSTTRTGTLIVTDTAPGGPQPSISLTGSAVATKLPAAVSVVAPGAGSAGTSVPVVITGNGWTTFSPSSVISFTDVNSGTYPVDITVSAQTFISINEIHATFTMPANTVANPVTYGARNIAVTTPLSGGGAEVARLESAFIIADPNNQHPITSVSPAFGTQGQMSLNVNLTATGTNFNQGITYANFGDGVTINSLTVTDATDAQANITISNTTPVGGRTITLVTGGEFAVSSSGVFQIGPNNATLVSVSSSSSSVVPVSEPQSWQGQVFLAATGTHFLQDATQVSFTGGILVGEVLVTSPTTATVDVAVQASAQIGLQNATVWTGGEIASLNNAFAVTGSTPLLLSVTPSSSPQGSSPTVVINANSYMNFVSGQVSAAFDGNISSPTVNVITPTQVSIPISISNNANVGSITANLIVGPAGSTVLYPFTFTVTQSSAAITSVSPSCVPQGGQLTLTVDAINTNWAQGTTTAAFYPVYWVPTPSFDEITINSPTNASLAIAVPTNTPAGSYEFYMATGGQVVNASVKVCAATPTLTMSPANGLLPFGSAVNSFTANFTGQFTHFGPTTEPVISGEGVTLTSFNVTGMSSATATVTIIANVNGTPTATGPRKITFTTGGEIVTTYFNVTKTPVGILSVSPYHGPQSTTMNVEMVGRNTHFTQADTTVQFGPQITVNGVTVNSTTDLIANITTSFNDGGILATPSGWQNVYVNSAAGTGFTTAAGLPTTTSGAGTGAMVSITASATGALTSCTAAAGGSGYQVNDYVYPTQAGSAGSACQVTAVSGTAIATMITVQEQVITSFLVDSPAMPSLVSVCVTGTGPLASSAVPCVSSAQQGATVDVTITGSLTNWNSTTEAILGAGVTVSNLTNTSPTTETATIAVSPTAPAGGNSVIMFTGSQIVSGTGFNVTPGASLIYSVGPTGCNANVITIADVCGVSNSAGTPYVITQLQTATLNIVGVGTHWLQGETTASFGSGVATDSLTITSPTTATAQITVLSTSPVGFASLTMTTDGEITTLQQAIDIEEGFPKILATSPAGGEQGNTMTLQVLGRFANWQQGVTSAAFNQDITVNSVTVIDSNNLSLNITVSPWAYVDFYPWISCGHVLTITTGTVQEAGAGGPSGTPGIFCVSQGAEEITNVTPLETVQGSTTSVTITGSATNFIAGVTQVSFGDPNFAVGQIVVNSLTSLTVPIAVSTSATPGFKTVTVSTYGQVASQQYSFTVSPGVGTLNEAIPNQAEQGAPIVTSPTCSTLPSCMVRLIGQYTHFSGSSTATFGAGITVDSVSYVSPTEVDAQITIDPLSYVGGRTVTVTTPGVSCAYQPPVATANIAYNGCTPGVPTGTGSEIVTANVFSIIPGPAIISNVAPNTGNEGQEVVFNITGEATHWAQNFTQFYIAGAGYDITVNSVVINNPTSATVDISISPTANPGPRSVMMVTDGEALTDRGAFVVTGGIPVISYVSPNSSLLGTTGVEVTVVGNAYTLWNASSTVSFGPGITVSSFQVDDTSHIAAILNIGAACTSPGVPAGCAQLGYRTVIVQTGTQVLTGNFQVTAPAPPPTPYIWYESPWSGLPGQTFTITFYGRYTNWDPGLGEACSQSGTTLTGFNASVTVNCFQVISPTTATANITISPTATASVSDLTLTTNLVGGGQEVDTANFSVVVSVPTLTVVDPGSSMQGTEDLTVNILGNFTTFDSTTTFNFGPGITLNGPPTIRGPGIATQSISIAQLATLGGRSVVATTPDATLASAQVVGGAGFTVTPSLALILAVTANTALQGQTPQVEITGQNTHWNGSTTFQFGDGIVVTKYQVNSLTDATVWLAIPAYAGEGPTWATATTLGEVATLNNAFVVQAGTPYLLSSGPGSEPQQSSSVFTILSQATNWLANPPTVSYGDGVVLTNVNVTGNTSLTVDGYIQPTTYTGWRNLTVTSGTQVLGLNSVLYISAGPAVINNVVVNNAGQGTTLSVTINGTNTHWQQGVTTLTFPNVLINGTPTVNSPTSITVNITVIDSAPAGEESITATTLGEVANGSNVFTITQTQPELLAVVASHQVQGWTGIVNLTGQYTSFNTAAGCSPNCTTANFGAGIIVNSVTASDSSHAAVNITVSPTTTLGYRNVTVTTGTQIVSLSNAFQVTIGPAAIVSALSPNSGAANQPYNVLVVGSQTHFLQGTTTANFGPYIQVTGVTVTDTLHATVAITIPSNTPQTFYDVSLTTGGEVATQLGAFTVTNGSALISAVSPPTGHQGDVPFDVNLTGLFTHFNSTGCTLINPCSTASFGSGITVGPVTATSPTQASVSVTIAPGATIGSRNVTVTTGTETASMTGGFSVLAGIPAITTVAPTSGQAGTTLNVVINGQFTTFQAGFSTVSLGSGITVNFIPNSSVTLTQLTANITIAANATVGNRDVSVTTNGTTQTLSNGFAVTAGTPAITQISPNFGNPGQTNLTITLTGQYTNWTTASTVTIGTAADGITVVGAAGPGLPGPVVTATATSITVKVNIAAGAPVGPAGVSVSTGESVPGGFTVQTVVIPPPSILSISPGMNAGGIPINSNFFVVFSQPMNIATFTNSGTTGTIILYLTSNLGQGWIAVPVGVNLDATGRVLTITPSSPLAVNSQYYLNLTSGIKDATVAGNSINAYGQYFNTVFSANTTPPTVNFFNPPALSTVGTNVPIELEFSTDMNQDTASGMTVSTGGNPVTGTFLWNSNPYGSNPPGWGPGTVLFFTPTTPLAANTTFTVAWGAPLADTAGNAVTSGSFTFSTGSGSDTVTNGAGSDIANYQTNIGTNVAPQVLFSKPVNPLYVNSSTVQLYNSDSGKYINGTVVVAPNAMSATFTPAVPLLPDTYYRLYMAWGYYDADGSVLYNNGAYLNGINTYFTTGNGADLTAPDVASISPANTAASVPLNAQVIVHFTSPIDPAVVSNIITVTPSGGSAINGTVSLASDLVTLFFVPSTTLASATVYTVQLSGYQDVIGNVGTTRSYTFTTMTSIAPISVSTGFNASGHLITVGGTVDPHWFVNGTATNAEVVASANTDWYGGWLANGPNSDWIAPNPNSNVSAVIGNTLSTTFNWTGSIPASNVCLVGAWGTDDWGALDLNGNILVSGANRTYSTLTPLNVLIDSYLVAGTNTLTLTWVNTDSSETGYRLQASVQTCNATLTGGLSLSSATPAYSTGGVATNSTIQLVFNHPLDPATVNSTTLPIMIGWNSNAEIAGAYTLSTTNVSNDTVTFIPDTPFPVSTQIWVGACNGPYDLAGDNAAINGCYTQLTYFNTASTIASGQPANTAFQVTAFSPSNGATNVGLRAPVTATFNRSFNPNSVNSNDYALFSGDSQSPWCSGGSYSHSQDGTSIQFNCGVLPSSATLTAFLGSGLQDWNGDTLTPYTSQFTTSYYDSNTNGSVISVRPGSGASGVNANLPIVLYFNLPLNAAGASSGIEVAQNNVAMPGTVQVLDGGYTLEFTPSTPWTPGALIQWWTTSSLTDTTYNTNINTTSGYFYVVGSTGSLTPTVQVALPSAYSSNVPLNSIFDLQFNTPMDASTINSTNVYLFDNSNGNVHVPVTLTQPQPNEIRMVPTSVLPANHYLYVYIGAGLLSTTSVPASQTQWYEYTGTTSDSTTPVVISAVPMNGETGVGVNVQPGVIFNKSIDPISVNANTFQVLNGATPLAGSYWFNSGNTRVEFVPDAPLPVNTILTMRMNGVIDQVGNPVTFSSSFTTGATPDVTAPSIVWTSFTSNERIPTNSVITVQFSEPMDASTFTTGQGSNCGNFLIYDTLGSWQCIATTLTWNASQTVAYLQPTSLLAAGRQYYIAVSGGTDIAGNQVNSWSTYFSAEFTSASTAPTVINFNPISGATGLGTNAIIEAQFSAPIDPTTIQPNIAGNVTLNGGGSLVQFTSVMSAGNTVLQLVPSVPLKTNTIYVLQIAGVKDPAGNTVATVSSSFTTGPTYDITAPSVVSVDPPNNATVGTNVVVKIVFNKPLNPITVNNSSIAMNLSDTGQGIPLTVTPSANGLDVTLTPQVPLLPNTTYRYYVGYSGYVQDQDGNNGYGGWYYFTTSSGVVNSPLTVTSVSPANGATAIPLNAQVIVMVSAPIDPTSWSQNSIQLMNGVTPVAGTVNWVNNQELSFAPTNPLSAGATYTVNVSGFMDANGNAVTPDNTTFIAGTAASTGGLTFTGSNIGWGATVTNPLQPIVMTFSQALDPATVNSSTLQVMVTWNSNRGLPGTYTVGTGANANQVTFIPAIPYPSGAQISVGECGGPTDILGDIFQNGSCYNQQLVYFYAPTYAAGTVGDPTSLSVVSVSPANGATNVRHDLPVSVTFSNPINNSSAGGYNTQLFAGQDLQTNGNVTWSADGRTMTFNVGALYNGATYTIAIPAGGVSDEWGNSLTAPFISTFTTASNPATGNGSVQSTNPGNTSGIPTDTLLTLYMNRQVNPSTVSASSLTVTVNGQVYAGTVQVTGGDYEIQFTPTLPFPNSATVQWFLSGSVMDVYGDYFSSTSGYFYTLAAPPNPATAWPTIIAVSPRCCGETNIPTNANVEFVYNLPIDPTTLAGNIYINSGPATPFTLSMPSPNIIRLTPNTPWTASTWYGFCTNSSVMGTNGVAAQSDCWAAYFTVGTTTDTTSGTVKIGPPDGSVNVGTNAFIRLQFSKPVDVTTINSTNVTVTALGNPVPGTWSYSYSGSDIVGANFLPVNPLPASTQITVNVNGLLDYAGNLFSEPTVTFTTAATPDYSSPNVTLDFNYWQSGIGTNASFNCRYSEAMDPSSINDGNTYIYSYVTNAHVPVNYIWSMDLMTLTMTPVTPLFADAQYIYYCQSGIDLTGNAQNGNSAGFYTGNGPSSAGPKLIYANPPSGMTNVPVNTNQGPWYGSSLGLLFNEPVASESVGNITLTPAGGSPMPIGVYPEYGNTIAWVQLPWVLAPNTQYTFNLTGVTDMSGNPIAAGTTSTFTTGASFDFSSPTVASTSPANGVTTTGVPTTTSITFNEAIDPVLINNSNVYLQTHNTHTNVPVTISFSADYKTVILTPTAPLAELTIYDLVIYGNNFWPYDIAGNSLNVINYVTYNNGYVYSEFTTGTTAAVAGVCGTANTGTFSVPPTANLCSTGTASAVNNAGGAGGFTWSCGGQYGGTAASCSATVTPATACYAQQSGLVSWWKGDGDATDHMGNNNGTLENGAGFALGAVNDAFNFNGSNQYVLIGQPVPADLQIQNNITLSAWVYMTSYPGNNTYGTVLGSEYGGNHAGIGLYINGQINMIGVPPGSIDFDIGNGSSWYSAYTTTQMPLNQWVLVTAVASANNPDQIYYNGVLQPAIMPSGETIWNGTVPYTGAWFAIGQSEASNDPFSGLMDEVQVYNTALTAGQVQSIYNAGSAGVCP
jgi:hypothetical protein